MNSVGEDAGGGKAPLTDAADGSVFTAPTTLSAGVKSMARFGDSEVWVGGKDGTVAVYQLAQGKELRERQRLSVAMHDSVTSLCWVPLPGSTRLQSLDSPAEHGRARGSNPHAGFRLWCGCQSGRIVVLNTDLGRVEHSFVAHGGIVHTMFAVEDVELGEASAGTVVWSASLDCCIRIHEAESYRPMAKLVNGSHFFRCLAFVSSTSVVWAASTDKTMFFHQADGKPLSATDGPRGRLRLYGDVHCMAFDAEHDLVWAADDAHLRIYGVQSYEPVQKIEECAKCICFAESLAWVGGNKNYPSTVTAYSRQTFAKVYQLLDQPWLSSLVFLRPFVVASCSTSPSLLLYPTKAALPLLEGDGDLSPSHSGRTSSRLNVSSRTDGTEGPPSHKSLKRLSSDSEGGSTRWRPSGAEWGSDQSLKPPRRKRSSPLDSRFTLGASGKPVSGRGGPLARTSPPRHESVKQQTRSQTNTARSSAGSPPPPGLASPISSGRLSTKARSPETAPARPAGPSHRRGSPKAQPGSPYHSPPRSAPEAAALPGAGPGLPSPKSMTVPATVSLLRARHLSEAAAAAAGPPVAQPPVSVAPAPAHHQPDVAAMSMSGTDGSVVLAELPPQLTVDRPPTDPPIVAVIGSPQSRRSSLAEPPTAPRIPPVVPKLRITSAMQTSLLLYEEHVMLAADPDPTPPTPAPPPAAATPAAPPAAATPAAPPAAAAPPPPPPTEPTPAPSPAPARPTIPRLRITPTMQRSAFLFEDQLALLDVAQSPKVVNPTEPGTKDPLESSPNPGDTSSAAVAPCNGVDAAHAAISASVGSQPEPAPTVAEEGDSSGSVDPTSENAVAKNRANRSESVTTLGLRPPSPMEGPPTTPTIEEPCKVYIPPLAIAQVGKPALKGCLASGAALLSPGKRAQYGLASDSDRPREHSYRVVRRSSTVSPLYFGKSPQNSHRSSPTLPKWRSVTHPESTPAKSPQFISVPPFAAGPTNGAAAGAALPCSLPVLDELDLSIRSRRSTPDNTTPLRGLSFSSNGLDKTDAAYRHSWSGSGPPVALTSPKGPPGGLLASALPTSAPSYRGSLFEGPRAKPGSPDSSFRRAAVTRHMRNGESTRTSGGHLRWVQERDQQWASWSEGWLDFGWSPADSFWQHQLAELFQAHGFPGLKGLDLGERVAVHEAKHRRRFLAQQLRNFVATQAVQGAEQSGDARLRSMEATVRQVLADMESLGGTLDRLKEASQAAADFHRVSTTVARLRAQFFPQLAADGCPTHRSTASSTFSPSVDSARSCATSQAISPLATSLGDDGEPPGAEGQMVLRVLDAVREHLQACQSTAVSLGHDMSSGRKRTSVSLGDLPDLICQLQASLDDAHRREQQFVHQSRDKYERLLALESEVKKMAAEKAACTVAFSDALIRLGENLDFLALLTHCDDAKGPGKLSDFVSLRFSNIDAGVIKTAADMMMQRLRAVECALRDRVYANPEHSRRPRPHGDLD